MKSANDFWFNIVQKKWCLQIEPLLKVEIEDGRKAPHGSLVTSRILSFLIYQKRSHV